MNPYNCTSCNFSTTNKTKYTVHTKSNKHLRNVNIKCDHCGETFGNIESLIYHRTNKCIEYYKAINKMQENKINECEIQLCNRNKEIEELLINQTKLIAQINTKTQKNAKYILNNFKDAPNYSVPQFDLTLDEIIYYANKGHVDGVCELFAKVFPNDVDPADRSFWNLDSNRAKFLTRINDRWILDINGSHISKLFIDCVGDKIVHACNNILAEQNDCETYDERKYDKESEILNKISSFGHELVNKPSTKKKMMKQVGPLYNVQSIANDS